MTDSIINTKEPVAGLSAASSCITLNIDGAPSFQFRPVFTHQCFDNEFINGWRPLVSAEESSMQVYKSWNPDSNDKLHTSYKKLQCINQDVNKGDDTRLSVHISLSPSCEKTCLVKIQTVSGEPLSMKDEGDSEPATKKQKKHVSFAGVPEEDDKLQPQQMDIKDIVQKISSAVPPIQSVVVNDISREDLIPAAAVEGKSDTINENNGVYLKAPLGKVLLNYSRQIKKKSDNGEAKYQKFILTLADGSDPSVASYHNKVQSLAKWFIEAGDDVDLSDETNGSWKVMYLFEQHKDEEDSSNKLSLAGYMTLLHVNSPFRKPNPGIIVRVCQALILPPYHKAGHGTQILNSVYDYAARNRNKESSSENICEINVEDPAPAFVRLRDCVDYQRFLTWVSAKHTSEVPDYSYLIMAVTDERYFDPVSDEHLLPVAEYLKITKRQCQKIHDIHKLSEIVKWKDTLGCTLVDDIDGSKKAQYIKEVETKYRLMVKKSLKQLRIEELSAACGKEEQKALLSKWFDETLKHYHRVLKANDMLGKRR